MGILNSIKYVTDPQLSIDDQSNPYALQQRQQLINALKQQAVNPAQMPQSGNVVARQSWVTPLAQALSGYYAGKMQKNEDTAMKGLADKKSAASQALIQSLYGQPQQSSPQPDQSAPQQVPQASQMPSPSVGSMFNSPQQSQQVPQQPMPQAAPQQQDPYAAARQKIAVIAQGIQSGTIDPELGKQLLTQAQKDATPADDYTLGDNRFSGRTNQMIAEAPGGEDKPLDELAKLTADLKAGRINQSDFNARRNLMTTRAPNMYTMPVPSPDGQPSSTAKLIANYELPPPSPARMTSASGMAIMDQVLKLNPDYHGEEYPTRQAAYKGFASGKQGDQVRAFNVGISHLNTASELADQLNNTNSPAYNKVANFFAQQTGEPAPTNFDTAKQVVKSEIVKAVVGGQASQTDREEALAGVDKASSPAQLKGAIKTAQALMSGQLGGLKRQFEGTTGRKDFERLLSEDAKQFMNTKEALGDKGDKAHPPAIQSLLDKYK